jgi:hypothetical protein
MIKSSLTKTRGSLNYAVLAVANFKYQASNHK